VEDNTVYGLSSGQLATWFRFSGLVHSEPALEKFSSQGYTFSDVWEAIDSKYFSWDWIMPVVLVISGHWFKEHPTQVYLRTFHKVAGDDPRFMARFNNFQLHYGVGAKEALLQACVDFIENYESNPDQFLIK
jgi:hypothetical protein